MFPKSWRYPPINAPAFKIQPDEVERSIKVIKAALHKYPPALIERTLKKVYVVDTLVQSGVAIGGTYATETIYLTNAGVVEGYNDAYIEKAFHEEYSSILWRLHPEYFDRNQWLELNPPEFEYLGSGYEAIRDDESSMAYDPDLFEDGFLYQYATSEIENDFNSIASSLFVGQEVFWQAVEQHDRIRGKASLVIDFYEQIDPLFTEEYFQSLRLRPK